MPPLRGSLYFYSILCYKYVAPPGLVFTLIPNSLFPLSFHVCRLTFHGFSTNMPPLRGSVYSFHCSLSAAGCRLIRPLKGRVRCTFVEMRLLVVFPSHVCRFTFHGISTNMPPLRGSVFSFHCLLSTADCRLLSNLAPEGTTTNMCAALS